MKNIAGDLWRLFGEELRPTLEHEPILQELSRKAQLGDENALRELAPMVFARVEAFYRSYRRAAIDGVPHSSFWYDDGVNAGKYRKIQDAALPMRREIMARAADYASARIAQDLDTQPRVYVLDVGTGDGSMAIAIAERHTALVASGKLVIVASDRSEIMLRMYRSALDEHGIHILPTHLGDLRDRYWTNRTEYKPYLGSDFDGFSVITGMACLHMIPNRASLYSNMCQILTSSGTLIFSHDFFEEGTDWVTHAPINTLVGGYAAYARSTPKPVSFLAYLAGFQLRRAFLQGDKLCTLREEGRAVRASFTHARSEQHRHHPEFTIITASNHEIPETAANPSFQPF